MPPPQLHMEGAAGAQLRFGPDPPALLLHQVLGEVEPQARARPVLVHPQSAEGGEDLRSNSSAGMPGPLSAMLKVQASGVTLAQTRIWPGCLSLNLTALESRL